MKTTVIDHRDHATIKSFKQTFNAAILIWVAKPRSTAGGSTAKVAAAVLASLAGFHCIGGLIGHGATWMLAP